MAPAKIARAPRRPPLRPPLNSHKFHRFKASLTQLVFSDSRRVLDVGFGLRHYEAFAHAKDYVGLDVDGLLRPDVVASADWLPFRDECFDGVLMFDVLEHVRDAARALRECVRVMRREGRLLLTTPNTLGFGIYDSFADPTHVHHFTWRSVNRLLKRAGLKDVTPMPLRIYSFWPLSLLTLKHLIPIQQSICLVASKG
jgi:SAM-dependent methyltransferase